MTRWMKVTYICVLKGKHKLEDIWLAEGPYAEFLISPKERVPPGYKRRNDLKKYIEELHG